MIFYKEEDAFIEILYFCFHDVNKIKHQFDLIKFYLEFEKNQYAILVFSVSILILRKPKMIFLYQI